MRTFLKATQIALIVTAFGAFYTAISMFYWPSIPSSPRPAEGRVYALNNHGWFTYMNKGEHELHYSLLAGFMLAAIGAVLIQHFVDPFDQKRLARYSPLRPRPPWEQMK
jgi:hypothetical protein